MRARVCGCKECVHVCVDARNVCMCVPGVYCVSLVYPELKYICMYVCVCFVCKLVALVHASFTLTP